MYIYFLNMSLQCVCARAYNDTLQAFCSPSFTEKLFDLSKVTVRALRPDPARILKIIRLVQLAGGLEIATNNVNYCVVDTKKKK